MSKISSGRSEEKQSIRGTKYDWDGNVSVYDV